MATKRTSPFVNIGALEAELTKIVDGEPGFINDSRAMVVEKVEDIDINASRIRVEPPCQSRGASKQGSLVSWRRIVLEIRG